MARAARLGVRRDCSQPQDHDCYREGLHGLVSPDRRFGAAVLKWTDT
jgi:hypothetical protein